MKISLAGMNVPHPIPYQGSKRSIARHILPYIPFNTTRFVEPFAGSAAVSLAVACKRKADFFWLNDLNEPLAKLWSLIICEPAKVSSAYKTLWNEQHGNEADYYKGVRTKFNETQRPEYLLYLLARCVKAAVRYNGNGEFNQSPDNRRKGMKPSTMTAQIFGASSLLEKKTQITSLDFRELTNELTVEDVVYMDPPYQGVCSNRDRRYIGSLDFDTFVAFLEALNLKGVSYIVSYDGRTGNKKFGKDLPASLNLEHEEIKAGKSSQATLLGRNAYTYESLYLSHALIERLAVKPKERQLFFSISSDQKFPQEFLKRLDAVRNKRARAVIDRILTNGYVTTEELKEMGYDHPPRAARDVRELGIPLETFYDKRTGSGRRMGSYRFGDLSKLRSDRLGGRFAFPKTFKPELVEIYGSRCNVCAGPFESRYLQIDHRIPYEIGGDSENRDAKEYQLLDGSCNRAKSWSCENCANWTDIRDADMCKTCYWASPESYEHVAMRKVRRIDVLWDEDEVKDYDEIKKESDRAKERMPEFVKAILKKLV